MTVRLRKGTKIKVPQEMVDEIRQHVNNSWMYYPNPTNRTEHEIKNPFAKDQKSIIVETVHSLIFLIINDSMY